MRSTLSAEDIIRRYNLEPLEGEGGFVRRTWFRPASSGDEPEASCILYLVTPDSFSALHRLRHDEMFHFYLGDPCVCTTIDPDGEVHQALLGHDIATGMHVQHLVRGGSWQATRLVDGGSWALMGTTMSPGFHVDGWELATARTLGELGVAPHSPLWSLLASPDDTD